MRIITLITDLGHRDHYLATLKANLYSKIPDARIIDISNEVSKFNVFEASYLLKNSFHHFPEGTFHLIGVTSPQAKKNRYLLIYYGRQFILTPDNGLFKLFTDDEPESVIEIYHNGSNSPSFVHEVLTDTVQKITENTPVEEIGDPTADFIRLLSYQPVISPSNITGRCIYIDSFGNVITNITEKLFHDVGKGRAFSIALPGETIEEISENYTDVSSGDVLALFNSAGFLEIAINGENASKMIFPRNLNQNDFLITVQFDD
jgi:S-adenosyl-L-methionine hydrolase (adenosine-forming)